MTAKNLVYDCGFPDGAKRIRTADPLHAMQVLYQLSYGPKKRWNCPRAILRREDFTP